VRNSADNNEEYNTTKQDIHSAINNNQKFIKKLKNGNGEKFGNTVKTREIQQTKW